MEILFIHEFFYKNYHFMDLPPNSKQKSISKIHQTFNIE